MVDPTQLNECARKLSRNGFAVHVVNNTIEAGQWVTDKIKELSPESISFGDSETMFATGIIDQLRIQTEIPLIDGFDRSMPRPERLEIRRKGILADLFMTGINAVTMDGHLHWLDMIGNRIAPVVFGPRHVVLFAGRNKIVANDEEARQRIRQIAAPKNALKHTDFKTPCQKTGICIDCSSPDRICNTWMCMAKCFPKGRITIILIDQDLGL